MQNVVQTTATRGYNASFLVLALYLQCGSQAPINQIKLSSLQTEILIVLLSKSSFTPLLNFIQNRPTSSLSLLG